MIRFHNGRVLEGTAITENEVWVDGANIAYVGPAREDMPAFDRQVDLKGDLLMPGFKNAHTHSGMTFLRSAADDLPLQQWLTQQVFPKEAKLNPERLAAFVKVAFLEYLANGVTACFDMYFFIDEIVRIAGEWGFRTVLCESMTVGDDWEVMQLCTYLLHTGQRRPDPGGEECTVWKEKGENDDYQDPHGAGRPGAAGTGGASYLTDGPGAGPGPVLAMGPGARAGESAGGGGG